MTWILKRIIERIRPRAGSLTVASVLPLRGDRVRAMVEELPPGTGSLPGAVVEMRDAGPGQTEVSVTTRVPVGRFFLGLISPAIARVLLRKLVALLFPSLRRRQPVLGHMEYVVLIPFTADRSALGAPFTGSLPARYVLQLHLTQRTIPFEENAVSFEIFQETEVRTRFARHRGLCRLPVTRHTVFLRGSGGVIQLSQSRLDIGLCDEPQGLNAKAAFLIERPFGLGSVLPSCAGAERTVFNATDEMQVEIAAETLTRAVNEIWFLKLVDGREALETFLSATVGVNARVAENPIFLPRLKIERTSSKIVSVTDLVF